MTSTPADPIAAEAREIERIVAEVAARFLTFGIGGYKVMNNPISEWLAEKPPQFALGVSVEEVVRFVIERMKSAGRAEASAIIEAARFWRRTRAETPISWDALGKAEANLAQAIREYETPLPTPPEGGE